MFIWYSVFLSTLLCYPLLKASTLVHFAVFVFGISQTQLLLTLLSGYHGTENLILLWNCHNTMHVSNSLYEYLQKRGKRGT